MRACYKHRFIAVYRPPHYDLHCTGELMDCLNRLCDVAFGVSTCGDFNLPNINWKIGLDILNLRALEACLVTFIVDNGFSQLVHENTRHNNTLDLLLVNDLLAVANIAVTLPFSTSDHSAITWHAWFPPALPRKKLRFMISSALLTAISLPTCAAWIGYGCSPVLLLAM